MKSFFVKIFSLSVSIILSSSVHAAFNSAGTDYSIAKAAADSQPAWVSDPSNQVVNLADTLACLMKNSGVSVSGYANKTWVAYVNEQVCDVSDNQNVTTYAKMTVTSSLASTSSIQDLSVWAEFSNGENYLVSAQVSSSVSDTPPWGLWNFRFYRVNAPGGTPTNFDPNSPSSTMYGYASVEENSNGDIEVVSSMYSPEGGLHYSTQAKVVAASGSRDDISFVGKIDDSQNGSQVVSYVTGKTSDANAFVAEIDGNNNISNGECKARDNVWTTAWRYNLYNASTGEKYDFTKPGIDFRTSDGLYGNISANGHYLQGSPQADWSSIADRTYSITEESGDQNQFSLTFGQGQLIRSGWDTLQSINPNHKFTVWTDLQDGNGYREIDVKWNASNKAFEPWSGTWNPSTLNSNIAGRLNSSDSWGYWIWNATDRTSYRLEYSSNSSLKLSSNSTDYPFVVRARINERVNGETDFAYTGATFVCERDCISSSDVPVSITDHNNLGSWGSLTRVASNAPYYYFFAPADSSSFLPGTLYADNDGSETLTVGDKPVVFDFYTPYPNEDDEYFQIGSSTGTSIVNRNQWMNLSLTRVSSSCTITQIANGDSCVASNAYEWQAGTDLWNMSTYLKDSSGNGYAPSQEILVTATFNKSNDRNGNVAGDPASPSMLGDLAVTVPYGEWSAISSTQCNTQGGCAEVFSLDDYENQEIQTYYDGNQLHLHSVRLSSTGDWARLFNPTDGAMVFTDSDGNQWVSVAKDKEEYLIPQSSTAACSSDGIAISTAMSGLRVEHVPALYDANSYPMPSQTWSQKPTNVDTTCVIRDETEVCSN